MAGVAVVPERSPGSDSAGTKRGPLHPGTARQPLLERLWLALATAMGYSLLEAAQLAHGASEAAARLRRAVAAVGRLLCAAGRSLVGAWVRHHGWRLEPSKHENRWRAASMDGVATIERNSLAGLLGAVRRMRLTNEFLALKLLNEKKARRTAEREAQHNALAVGENRERRLAMAKRLRWYRKELGSEQDRRAKAEEAAFENGRRALEAEVRLSRLGAELEAVGGDLAEAREEVEATRTDVEVLQERSGAWKGLFVRALAIAVHQRATAQGEVEVSQEHAAQLEEMWREMLNTSRCMRRLLRAERREAAELRRGCEDALEALEDPDTAWTPAGVHVRQLLRGLLGRHLLPICSICGADHYTRRGTCNLTDWKR